VDVLLLDNARVVTNTSSATRSQTQLNPCKLRMRRLQDRAGNAMRAFPTERLEPAQTGRSVANQRSALLRRARLMEFASRSIGGLPFTELWLCGTALRETRAPLPPDFHRASSRSRRDTEPDVRSLDARGSCRPPAL
jgi:hypothetical protein